MLQTCPDRSIRVENPAPLAQLFLHFMACSSELGFPEEFAV